MKIDAKKLYLELKPYLTEEQKEKLRDNVDILGGLVEKALRFLASVTYEEDEDKGTKMYAELSKFNMMWYRLLYGSNPYGSISFDLKVERNAFIYIPEPEQRKITHALKELYRTLTHILFELNELCELFSYLHFDTLKEIWKHFSAFSADFISMYEQKSKGKEVKEEKKAPNTLFCPHCGKHPL